MLLWSSRAEGTEEAYLGCGMSPHLGAASDVQRVIELFVHLGSQGHGNFRELPVHSLGHGCPRLSPPPPRSVRKLQLIQYQGAHLADGGAEAALQDPLQGLQLLRGQLSATLQPLQQLHSPGHVCRKRQGPREHTPAARRATEVRLEAIHAPRGSPGPQPRARCWGALRPRSSHALRLQAAPRPP